MFRQLISEHVGTVAARDRVEEIVGLALDAAGLACVPSDHGEVATFVRRHLAAVIADELGSETADGVCRSLEEILGPSPVEDDDSGIRPRTPRFGASEPLDDDYCGTAATPEAPPVVLITSGSRVRTAALEHALQSRACVVRVQDSVELYDALHDPFAPAALVIDCARPKVSPETAAAMAPEMPQSIVVVLWGAAAEASWHVVESAGQRGRWIPCRAEVSGKAVADLCLPFTPAKTP